MFSSNNAKFYASITKVNNLVLFWTLAARLNLKKSIKLTEEHLER